MRFLLLRNELMKYKDVEVLAVPWFLKIAHPTQFLAWCL